MEGVSGIVTMSYHIQERLERAENWKQNGLFIPKVKGVPKNKQFCVSCLKYFRQ